ncbi:uncharacterized protein PAC_03871 [Phialocephala subalpina]|uniref:Uncharacterized protein n=1 Tax=Phialocephala subalpina TaxID=576137 RepID=A0A1L7WMK3_9HELO|nr:uncharacterized protein PAC_03871 [Phialocephala subalpina]
MTLELGASTVFQTNVSYLDWIDTKYVRVENPQFTPSALYLDGGLESSYISQKSCKMHREIVEYPVIVIGKAISPGSRADDTYFADNKADLPNGVGLGSLGDNIVLVFGTVVGGFSYYFSSLFNSSSILTKGVDAHEDRGPVVTGPSNDSNVMGAISFIVQSSGMIANKYMSLDTNFSVTNTTVWRDPMDDMLDQINNLASRTARSVAMENLNSSYTQNVSYSGQRTATVYQSDYTITAIAILVNFMGLLSVLPLYYGWWELGRKASLSVIEIAKAFGAPLLRDVDDNATAKLILKQVGTTRVVYGEVVTSERASSEFLIPRKGLRSRLQIVEERGKRPGVGMIFGLA